MSMALIYANAVNKRMHHGTKMKKRSTHNCPLHDESPDNDGRRSLSREVPIRKYSENSGCLSSSASSCHSLSPAIAKFDPRHHRPVQRSKTSCGDLNLKRIVEDEAVRKSSTPVMSQSMLNTKKHSNGESSRKNVSSKKSLIQKYDLEQKVKKENNKVDRRRSVSLDEEQWKKTSDEKKDDDGAFSKMKRKFSKLMFN